MSYEFGIVQYELAILRYKVAFVGYEVAIVIYIHYYEINVRYKGIFEMWRSFSEYRENVLKHLIVAHEVANEQCWAVTSYCNLVTVII